MLSLFHVSLNGRITILIPALQLYYFPHTINTEVTFTLHMVKEYFSSYNLDVNYEMS